MVDVDNEQTIRSAAAPDTPTYVSDLAQDNVIPVKKEGKAVKWVVFFVVLFLLLLVAVLGLRAFTGTPVDNGPTPTPIMFITPEPTPIPTPPVDKSTVKIRVLNGTGISGEAKFLEDILVGMGYESVETGNAPTSDFEAATIAYSESVPEAVVSEMKAKLEGIYSSVRETATRLTGSYDVEITTGLRPGVSRPTPRPTTVRPTTGATPSPTGNAKTTPTVTPTSSPSPSPTGT